MLHTDDFYTTTKKHKSLLSYIYQLNAKYLRTMLVPHFAPSGTRPGIMSDPGSVVKDLENS